MALSVSRRDFIRSLLHSVLLSGAVLPIGLNSLKKTAVTFDMEATSGIQTVRLFFVYVWNGVTLGEPIPLGKFDESVLEKLEEFDMDFYIGDKKQKVLKWNSDVKEQRYSLIAVEKTPR